MSAPLRDLSRPPDLLVCLADKDCPQGRRCDRGANACVDCLTDDHCDADRICSGGACVPGCSNVHPCAANLACCGARCVDTGADTTNCGGCGVACANGATCCAGLCADITNDAKNCGACGKTCLEPNAMPSCSKGVCMAGACNAGFADCNNNVADGCEISVASDGNNCGRCGRACALPNAQPACLGGACLVGSCNMGFRNCNGDPADGCEINVASDNKNCGACGNNCQALPHAAAGCAGGQCAVVSCAAGFGNCDKLDANGCEADLSSDAANCGACGKACPAPPNVVTTCTNSVCAGGGCQPGFADCNNNLADGCEAKLASDPKNCGKCGAICPAVTNGSAGCGGGVCGVGQCNPGFGDCDKKAANGCEVNLQTDAANCGACGLACANGQSCSNGQCLSINVCGQADEGFTATVTCPNGTTMVSIDFASYGTPSGMCGNYQTSACHAVNSAMIVSGICLGQNSCNVTADNNTFGDPCYGTYKHLYIQASCR